MRYQGGKFLQAPADFMEIHRQPKRGTVQSKRDNRLFVHGSHETP